MGVPRCLFVLYGAALAGCMNTPVLDGARVLPDGVWRANLNLAVPIDHKPLVPLEDRPPPDEWSTREQWKFLGQDPVIAVAAHRGMEGGASQLDLSVGNNFMFGIGAKVRLLDRGALSIATGGHLHLSVFSLLVEDTDDAPPLLKLSVPLWIGYEPGPWLSVYATERLQLWWVEPVGTTGAALQTIGVRVGTTFGIIAEGTYVLEPFYRSSGFQIAVAIYGTDTVFGSQLPNQ